MTKMLAGQFDYYFRFFTFVRCTFFIIQRTFQKRRPHRFRIQALIYGVLNFPQVAFASWHFTFPLKVSDNSIIVAIADKIPTKILEDDPKLLMWYDQAVTRTGDWSAFEQDRN